MEPTAPVQAHLFLLAGQHPDSTHAETLAAAKEYALAGEAADYAGVWIAEHHFISYGVCPSALAFAAYLLGATRRITVGTAACILSNRHPVALAEETVLLDELSGGRFALGVGRGGPWVDLEVFGTGRQRYADGFAESIDLLASWLSGAERVTGTGRFPFRPVRVVPRPRRPIPVWIAATSASTVELAARHGLRSCSACTPVTPRRPNCSTGTGGSPPHTATTRRRPPTPAPTSPTWPTPTRPPRPTYGRTWPRC